MSANQNSANNICITAATWMQIFKHSRWWNYSIVHKGRNPQDMVKNLSWGVVPKPFSIWDFHRGARLKIDVLFLKFAVLNFLRELATTGIKERLCYIPRIFQQLFTLWPFPSSTYIYLQENRFRSWKEAAAVCAERFCGLQQALPKTKHPCTWGMW